MWNFWLNHVTIVELYQKDSYYGHAFARFLACFARAQK